MKRFDIHTENKNAKWIDELLSIGFDGSLVVPGKGHWKGKEEKALDIVIYTDNAELVYAMGERIKKHNKQEAILIVETECTVKLI